MLPARGATIADATSSLGTTPSFTGSSVNATFSPALNFPYFVTVGTYSGQSSLYDLNVTIGPDAFTFNNTLGDPTNYFFNFSNESGDVSVTSAAEITWTYAVSQNSNTGSGAIQAMGQPGKVSNVSNAHLFGSDVTVANSGNITVTGATQSSLNLLNLNPSGFRTAGLSGILAVSYGDQDDNQPRTFSGGNVSVSSRNATIAMANVSNPQVLTAGISASSANGPEDDTKDGTYSVRQAPTVQVQLTDAAVTNPADAAAGIIATNTGAQFPDSGASRGLGGNVTVSLQGASSIALTGTTGVGIFAASEVYVLDDKKKTPAVEAGAVNVSLDADSVLTTGTANSTFSIGILAVSAGQDLYLSPYGSHVVNGTGSGDAGVVTVGNNGTIQTAGTLSVGIAAMSLGGAAIATSNLGNQTSHLGNAGDTTAQGSDVNVTNNGAVTTVGTSAYGVVALSSGGGGLINNFVAAGGNATSPIGLAIGGNGTSNGSGPGSNAGSITVANNGSIGTTGATSIGLIAQSVGGAGGNGGGQHAAFMVGDRGGNGGNGGAVGVTSSATSTLTTNGTNAMGILAQSVGGGGGNGGNAAGIFVAVGGKGGKGGHGGNVTADLGGQVTTVADHSTVVMAQSVGGGGGHGGSAFALGEFVDAGIGGSSSGGGRGGNVSVTAETTSTISSIGNNAAGIHLQSVGGGGGAGGHSYSWQGSAVLGISVSVGGNGGGGGDGGDVFGLNKGSLTTGVQSTANASTSVANPIGADSSGLVGQSVGGGGGHGGGAVARSAVIGGALVDLPVAINVSFALGGSGGSGGAGSNVSLQNTGSITTYGDASYGIFGQSVGGGGGTAKDSTAAGTLYSVESTQVNVDVSVGGSGGSGGAGGEVSILSDDTAATSISTFGQDAHGILAQSIGGGGGVAAVGNARAGGPYIPNFGNSSSGNSSSGNGSSTKSYAYAVGVGGNGGDGGDASLVSVYNGGTISTTGSTSYGVLAQAIGKGGGLAAGGAAQGDNNSFTADISVGGTGGGGGSAKADPTSGYSVILTNAGTISTRANSAVGMAAQSVGGGGGVGGSADSKAAVPLLGSIISPFRPSLGMTASIAVGGRGGGGGSGGPILAQNTGNITTQGDLAYGIVAQSISDGGGMGGAAATAGNSAFLGTAQQFILGIAVGGGGGASHAGGNVTVTNSALVATSGYGAHGLIAQSLSGGGGVGGSGMSDVHALIGLGIGASRAAQSADAGRGGALNVTNNGTVSTVGADAVGLLAQSIGGGGGLAHSGSESHLTYNGTATLLPIVLSANLGINATNTQDVNGGAVTISHSATATTTTQGDWSHGVVALSLGGGGGKSATIVGTDTPSVGNLTFQLGGTDGKGNGAAVSLILGGSLATGSATTGFAAYGVLAQSIGGGGGLAGDNSPASTGNLTLGGASNSTGGNGGAVTFQGDAAIQTRGTGAHGLVLQSLGGGGGVAGSGSSLAFSGNNTLSGHNIQLGGHRADGSGGIVSHTSTGGSVTTQGADAYGLVAQSIGGGGGIAITNPGPNQSGGSVVVGARTASNSNQTNLGGNVSLTLGSDVATSGQRAFAVVAQSIGGGGGIATTGSATAPVTLGANLGNVDFANFGGAKVDLTLASGSNITTTGGGAHAVIAQSIGGGGGIANADSTNGFTASAPAQSSRETHGYGSTVVVQNNASIRTSGNGAFGLLAQSIGGGGGLAGNYAGSTGGTQSSGTNSSSPGTNGNVFITSSGNIVTAGSGAVGIFAQNRTAGAYGMGRIGITTNATVSGGSGSGGFGVWVDGGQGNNTLTVNSGGSISALSNAAIRYTGADRLNVTNNGTVSGSISLSDASSVRGQFTNLVDASLFAQGVINADMTDHGSLFIGTDSSVAASATFTGHYVQMSTGTVVLDVIDADNYDQMLFSGAGNAVFGDEITINFALTYAPRVGDTFALIAAAATGTNTISGSWSTNANNGNVLVNNLGPGVEWQTSTGPGGSYSLTISAIPEPSTVVLFGFALAWGLWRLCRLWLSYQRVGD